MKRQTWTMAVILAASAFGAVASTASASLLAYDGFGNTTDGSTLVNAGTDSGWYDGWSSVASASTVNNTLTMPSGSAGIYAYSADLSTNSSAAEVSGYNQSTNGVAYRTFDDGSNVSTGTLWISFVMNRTYTGRFAGLSLYNNASGSPSTELIDIGVSDEGSYGWTSGNNWGIWNDVASNNGTVGSVNNPVSAQNTNTVFLVAEVVFNGSNTDAYLWVNPDSTTTFDPSSAYQSITGMATTGSDGLGSIRLFAGNNSFSGADGSLGTDAEFDEIRIGTTLADVVPEPASVGIVGIAAAFGLLRRRNRRAGSAREGEDK